MNIVVRAVKVLFIKIGNSLGIRLTTRPRYGWDEQFQAMTQRGDDQFLDKPTVTDWDRNKWSW